MSVTLEHVTRSIDGLPAIRDVSLTLERGTLSVLLGPTLSGTVTWPLSAFIVYGTSSGQSPLGRRVNFFLKESTPSAYFTSVPTNEPTSTPSFWYTPLTTHVPSSQASTVAWLGRHRAG